MEDVRTLVLTLPANGYICADIRLRDKHVLKVEMEGDEYSVVSTVPGRGEVLFKPRTGFLATLRFAEAMPYDRTLAVIFKL